MSETKWTPGPWKVRLVERDGELRDCFVQAPDVNGYPYAAEILGDDEYREQSGGMLRKKADAHLIAAAPDLYAALKMAQLWLDVDGRYDMLPINAALSRARGEKP